MTRRFQLEAIGFGDGMTGEEISVVGDVSDMPASYRGFSAAASVCWTLFQTARLVVSNETTDNTKTIGATPVPPRATKRWSSAWHR